MIEGQSYPELRRMTLEPHQMIRQRLDSSYWQQDWGSLPYGLKNMKDHFQEQVIPAVRITMPKEDFERLMSIYTAHYHAAGRNPAVADAWHQYKMLVALTER